MAGTIENLLRWIFTWIDRLVILVMNIVYKLLMQLSSLNIVNMDIVKSFSMRIGLILGIFMLFNLAINFLNYIVSPDKFSDKGKGGPKIILNIITSLVLLVTYNMIFEGAYRIQNAIVTKQIIPQIIFGTIPQDEEKDIEIAYYVYSSLISINKDVDTNGACENVYYTGITDECDTFLSNELKNSYMQFEIGVRNKDASKLLTIENINAKARNGYVFDYLFLFSTVVGVIITLIMFNFCIDIAKRSVKLYFYQIIAPVPIVANMIPGKGEETFKKWYKSCISTYLDLFIRLIAIFFAVFIISLLYSTLTDTFKDHKFLGLFIILGALMFANEIPQLLQDLTGVKLDGNFTINPLKKIQQSPLAAGALGYVGARVGGAAANLWGASVQNSNVRKQLDSEGLVKGTASYNKRFKELHGNTFGGYVGSAIAGSHSAGIRSFWSGITGKGSKTVGQIVSGGISDAGLARKRRDAGYNLRSRILDTATNIAQISNDYGTTDILKGEVKKYQQDLENAKQQENMLAQQLSRKQSQPAYSSISASLAKVFDRAAIRDTNGKFVDYKIKTYDDYLEIQAQQEYVDEQVAAAVTSGAWNSFTDEERVEKRKEYMDNWKNTLTAAERTTRKNHVKTTGPLDETGFNELNNDYIRMNEFDVEARNLEKKMKTAQENIAKQSGQK